MQNVQPGLRSAMPDKKPSRRLIVRELRKIHTGQTSTGARYTIWQVVATTPDGRAIDQTLRTFEELPRNVVIEVTVEKHTSVEYGVSYTLAQVEKVSAEERMKLLEDRVKRLEGHIYGSGDTHAPQLQSAPPAPPPPAPPPTPPPPAVPYSSVPAQRPLAPDDIPF